MATVDPYKQIQNAYDAQTKAINAANDAQVQEKALREQKAQQTLASSNRGVNTSYQRAVGPQNKFQQQNNFSSGVSDYLKNASYNTYLKGLGANQQNYNDAINNSNALWNNWVAQKAGQEAENAGNLADRMVNQSNTDREFNEKVRQYNTDDAFRNKQFDWQKATDERDYNRSVFESDRTYNRSVLESDRDYDFRNKQFDWQKATDERDYNRSVFESDRGYNYQVERDKVGDAQWDKEFNEGVRQFDLNYGLAKGSTGGGGGGGGSSRGGSPTPVTSTKSEKDYSGGKSYTNVYGNINDNKKASSEYVTDAVTGEKVKSYEVVNGYAITRNASGVIVSKKKVKDGAGAQNPANSK